ncbi:MAG TPA: trypsin-like peptidase domain-containing protein [Candidatus Paceibacterota bacterium]|nr:trypsin-like peptidase domain-containing protein [Candidatus Paceibacterota bacterium]
MKRKDVILFLIIWLIATCLLTAVVIRDSSVTSPYNKHELTRREIYLECKKSVGLLDVTHRAYFGDPRAQIFFALFPVDLDYGGSGTAWFFDKDRPYILTNAHVVNCPNPIALFLSVWSKLPETHKNFLKKLGTIKMAVESTYVFIDHDGKKYSCKIIANLDKLNNVDLAVLSVDIKKWKPLPIGNPDSIKVCDVVYVMGSPLGYVNTFNMGYVSAINRKIGYKSKKARWTLHDAHINPGNSGGPMLNKYCEVVGVNTLVPTGTSGMSHALNIDILPPLYFLVRDRTDEKYFCRPPENKK